MIAWAWVKSVAKQNGSLPASFTAKPGPGRPQIEADKNRRPDVSSKIFAGRHVASARQKLAIDIHLQVVRIGTITGP